MLNCYGRKRICIPLSSDELTVNNIKKYLKYVMDVHESNAREYKRLHEIYTGKQDILNKIRKYSSQEGNVTNTSNEPNNKTVENHIFSMVEFKKGYMYGKDIKYSASDGISSDDIGIINRYMRQQNKASKNVDLAEDIYIAGCGYRLVLPKKEGACKDIKTDAPFEIYNLEFERSGIVYSSDYRHEKLFGYIITIVETKPIEKKKLTIYTKDMFYEYSYFVEPSSMPTGEGQIKIKCNKKQPISLGIVPIVEYKLNKSRLGIVEIAQPILDGVNTISSNSLDNIEDFVNSILAIYNMDVDTETSSLIKKYGLLPLQTNDPTKPADAKYLVNGLDFNGIISEREARLTVAYDIVGVPRASSQTTSGGDTGQARLLGGGWSRAEIVGNQDIISLTEGERDMLGICLHICNSHPECKVNDMSVNDIEITFNINKSDNLLVKTQSLQNLHSINMPKDAALGIVGLVGDTYEVARRWEDYEKATMDENKKLIENAQ